MASPTAGAKTLLANALVGDLSGGTVWPIFIGEIQDAPDEQIVLSDTGGFTPNPAWIINYLTIQAMVRGKEFGYDTAYAKTRNIQEVLLGLAPQDISGDRWCGVTGIGDVTYLRNDDRKRPLFVVNFRIIMELADSALSAREPL